jgi:Flp pilus assembly protein TadB
MTYLRPRFKSSGSTKPADQGAARTRLLRLFWSCMVLGLFAVVVLVWLFGLTWWTILIVALVIACPAIATWLMLEGPDVNRKPPRSQ